MGLATYDRSRFLQGRSQAIWAVVLSGILILVGLATFSSASMRQMGGGSRKAPREELAQHGCAVNPPAGWVPISPKVLKLEAAATSYRRIGPEMFMALIADELGEGYDLEALTEIVKSNLAAGAQVEAQQEEDLLIRGRKFHRIMTNAKIERPRLNLYYDQWLHAENGRLWQIILWGSVSERQRVGDEARKFAEGLEALPNRSGPQEGTLKDVSHPELGFATRLAGKGWAPGGKALDMNGLMPFTATRSSASLVVMPLRFDEEPPDLEALTRGMLSTMNFEYPLQNNSGSSEPFSSPAGEGVELTTRREVAGKNYNYIFRIVRGERHALLVGGWAPEKGGELESLREALHAIDLTVPHGPSPPPTAQPNAIKTLLNEAGLSLVLRQHHEAAAHWFRRAYEMTRNDPAILGNIAYALEHAGKVPEALAAIETEAPRFSKVQSLQLRRARLLALNGDPAGGQKEFLRLIDQGFKEEPDLLEWLNLMVKLERADLGEQAATAWLATRPSVKVRRWQAEVVAEGGDLKRAIAQLEKLAADAPQESSVRSILGRYLNLNAEHARAQEIAEKLLAEKPDNVEALELLGWSQMGRKWYREAKLTFERAMDLNRESEPLRNAVRRASALLGEGNNSDVKEPIEPVPVPLMLAQKLEPSSSPADLQGGHPAIVLARSTGYYFAKDKPLRRTLRRRFRVQDQAGVNLLSTLEYPFDPVGERIFLNRLEVKNERGEQVAAGSINDAYVRDPEESTVSHRKVLQVPVPGLHPGYLIEVEVTTEDRALETEFQFARHLFAYNLPCLTETIYVSGDVARIKSVVQSKEIETIRGEHSIAWSVPPQPAEAGEPLATQLETRRPILWIGHEGGDWAAIGKKYLDEIADRLKPDPVATALAKKLCAPLKTNHEKIAALAREVQKELGYKAIEFGVRARRPNAVQDTLRQRFGDCKDQALVLHQLLRAVSIESHLALVNTEVRVQPDLPSLDQFNHMVVHVPDLSKDWLIDPTNKHLALDALPAPDLWHSRVLVLDGARSRLLPPPAPPVPGSAQIQSRRTVSPSGKDWKVEETLTFHGYYAAWVRQAFSGQTPTEQTRRAQSILSTGGAAELQEFRFENLDEPAQPARMRMIYRVREAIHSRAGKALAVLPALWERSYLSFAFLPQRTTPFIFRYPFSFSSKVAVNLAKPARIEGFERHENGPFADWKMKVPARHDASPGVEFEFQAQTGQWPRERYAEFYEAFSSAQRAWDTTIEWPDP